jgi:hypothetical protein
VNAGEAKRVASFLKLIHHTSIWLDRHFSDDDLAEPVRRLAGSTREYLQHCRRHVRSGDISIKALDRRRANIDHICARLWELAYKRK